MEARKKAAPAPEATAWDPLSAWTMALDATRQQAVVATEATCAMLSGFEAMRAIQQRAAHRALQRHSAAAERLKGRCGPMDVLSIQMELAQFDAEAAGTYWRQLATTALQMQARMAACGCELVDADKLLEACAVLEHQ